jgi:hypothetical protein
LLAATLPNVNLLAVNINYPSTYSVLAASAILAHYGHQDIPIGIKRPLTNATFFDSWFYELGEYASKIAYHWSGGSLPWGHEEEAWKPVSLYRKLLASAEDCNVTIASIGFLDNVRPFDYFPRFHTSNIKLQLSELLNSSADIYSDLNGRDLVNRKVSELVIMGGGYPSGYSFNFWGSNSSLTAHVINSWEGRMVFVGDDVGEYVMSGGKFMEKGPTADPVRMAYIYYTHNTSRSSWDPLTIMYAVNGLGNLFEYGNDHGYNHIETNGTNRWIWDAERENQFFLRLKIDNETAAAELDRLFLKGAIQFSKQPASKASLRESLPMAHEEL